MADLGLVRAQLSGIPDEKSRRILMTVFEYLMGNLTFGEPEHQARAKNHQSYFLQSTTAAVAGTEFSIVHGLTTAPHLAIAVVDLKTAGSQLVPLSVSRVADSKRVYFTSTSTSAPFAILVE